MSGQSLEFSEGQIATIAEAYDPAIHEAPIVVGHPRTDAPAYGWIRSLRAEGAELFAEPDQVEPEFAEMVRAGRFKRISASFYPPKAAANPAPGGYYLKHVGFLGAQPPAVKGLKAAEFAEDAEAVTLEIAFSEAEIAGLASAGFGGLRRVIAGLRDWLLASQGQEVADQIVPAHELEHIRTTEEFMRNVIERQEPAPFAEPDLQQKETDMSQEDKQTPEERLAALERREAEQAAREAAFAEAQAETRRAEDAALLDTLAAEGRIAPGLKDEMAAFMESLDAQEVVAFAEGKSASPRQWFRDLLLKQTKPLIDFSERAGGETLPQIKGHTDVTAAARRLMKDAEAEGRTLSFAEAARQIEETMESDNA
ncbi:hypothetical protein SAMN05443999_101248 [Roseovarius azorensis]|uniref:Mu-like prophage I protein n=2 Tax=Roseovarius azorensis TaxID=1287727 RepID=A0A1H7G743_9RHOB|nr:hypothetical protein SAMN05443999_101248 [Roseovarius azorensis]